ncbi:hypothetical protein Nmel_001008 [Mimus melanotis]|jgi:hypothetical protein
MSQD